MTTEQNSLFIVITEEESATVSGGSSNLILDTATSVAYGGNNVGSLALLLTGRAFVNVNIGDKTKYEDYLNANPELRRSLEAAKGT